MNLQREISIDVHDEQQDGIAYSVIRWYAYLGL
jgi:hypothetical protein